MSTCLTGYLLLTFLMVFPHFGAETVCLVEIMIPNVFPTEWDGKKHSTHCNSFFVTCFLGSSYHCLHE